MEGWLKEQVVRCGGRGTWWIMPVGPYRAVVAMSRWGWDYTISGGELERPERVGSWQDPERAKHECEQRLSALLGLSPLPTQRVPSARATWGNVDRAAGCSEAGQQA